ncbi:hypothetical protein FBT96_12500 [Rhodobacter capsulatus]|uniref:Uncharacterized protein n=1 Tax=Rhodobacter capsulatus TaxID=1061 RepID=A0A4U1JPL6_RHOCA|nr:hypothetical protein [Rhodobacter capsulatus]TKD17957.1 hypothetical protein FBT96_12500 [Rhodobacter capsulatus]
MTQPTKGGSYLRDPDTGALICLTNSEAPVADATPPSAAEEVQGGLSTETVADTIPAATAAPTRKGR